MTEAEWNVCTRPNPMLRFLLGTNDRVQDVEAFPACKASDRKLRLFACGCYWRVRRLLPNPLAKSAVETAERFADGVSTADELQQIRTRLQRPIDTLEERWRAARGATLIRLLPTHAAFALAGQVVRPEAPKAAYYASSNAYLDFAAIANPLAATSDAGFCASRHAEERVQCGLLRDIIGSQPFRSPTAIDLSWRAWNDGAVPKMAQVIYDDRAFDRLPLLADALEDAGCMDAELLRHLRGPGPHVRGCFALDLLLGKA